MPVQVESLHLLVILFSTLASKEITIHNMNLSNLRLVFPSVLVPLASAEQVRPHPFSLKHSLEVKSENTYLSKSLHTVFYDYNFKAFFLHCQAVRVAAADCVESLYKIWCRICTSSKQNGTFIQFFFLQFFFFLLNDVKPISYCCRE